MGGGVWCVRVGLWGGVGGTTPLSNITFTSAALIQVGNNITVTGANTLTFPDPVSLTGASLITTNNGSVTFGATLNGGEALTIAGGTGTATFTGTADEWGRFIPVDVEVYAVV